MRKLMISQIKVRTASGVVSQFMEPLTTVTSSIKSINNFQAET